MDGQKTHAKLTRTQSSSLLRSSPTVRSSIQSLSSVNEITHDYYHQHEGEQPLDLEEQKPHSKSTSSPVGSGSMGIVSGSSRLVPVLALLLLSAYMLFAFFNRDDIPTSENLLLSLILVAVVLFLAARNKVLIHQSFHLCKKLCGECTRKLLIPEKSSKPIQWFIGEANVSEKETRAGKEKRIIREGVEFYSNGDFYEGEFHKGRCNGSGVYNYFVNGRYEGDWIDGRYDGYGVETWARGSRYRGQYSQGLRHGYGVYKFFAGDSYAGQWCNGQSHGVGVQTCSDASCYIGEFKCGVKHGLGVYHFRNGDSYAGEYFGDKVHGFGVYDFANGHCYEGSWHEGRKQGYGLYTFRNGDTRCGEWDCGNLRTPLREMDDALSRAVQAARKMAENAIHLQRVDEQVNKAVMAANRAATAARVAAVKAVQNRIDGKFCDTNI